MLASTFAIIELNSQADILANLQAIEQGVALAVQHNADCVVLPENAFCFGNQAHAAQFFEPLVDWCGKLARQYDIHFLAGTLPCPFRPDGTKVADGKFRQSSLLFDPAGELLARYDKIHLFKATVNDRTGNYDEGRTFEAGNQAIMAKTAIGNIGMMVCFDIRFAPLALRLRQMGAEILSAPSAFTFQTGKAHWQTLLTARALDSQCWMIGAGQTGEHFFVNKQGLQQRETWGHSQFVDANGVTLDEAMPLVFDPNVPTSALIAAAKRWLPTAKRPENLITDESNLVSCLNSRVVIAQFDKTAQQHYRQAIDLYASQRFEVSL